MINEKDLKTIFNKPNMKISTKPKYYCISRTDKELHIYVMNDTAYKKISKYHEISLRKNCLIEKGFTKTLNVDDNGFVRQKTVPITKVFIHESLIHQKIRQNILNRYLN